MTSSLAAVLQRYPVFAGRLNIPSKGDYQVVLNGAGAELTTATCTGSVQDVLPVGMSQISSNPEQTPSKTNQFKPRDLSDFFPKFPSAPLLVPKPDYPLLYAQITEFQRGGTALSLIIPHLIADQDTCRMLLKAWAEEYTAACNPWTDMRKITFADMLKSKGSEVNAKEEIKAALNMAQNHDGGSENSGHTSLSKHQKNETDSPVSSQNSIEINSSVVVLHAGEELDSRAAPALPPGWSSARFTLRTWNFYPDIFGAYYRHKFLERGIETVAYHVTAARLAELKREATIALSTNGTALGADGKPAWISTNDALVGRIRQVTCKLSSRVDSAVIIWVNLRSRVVPPLASPALGNCIWSVALDSPGAGTSNLGTLAAEVRGTIKKVEDGVYIPNEIRWLADKVKGRGVSYPCVFQNAIANLSPSGAITLSNWNWGQSAYSDLSFGGGKEATPLWHQPPMSKLPNSVYIVPAAAAAPGGGVIVHITFYKRLAAELKTICPML